MSLLQNSNAISTGGDYNLESSLRFRSSASAYLSRTPTSAGSTTKFTLSFWAKRGDLGVQYQGILSSNATIGGGDAIIFGAGSNDFLGLYLNGGISASVVTTQQFRDPSAWYHIVVAVDTTQATAANRVIFYVNGVQVTSYSTATYPALNYNIAYLSSASYEQRIGNFYTGYFDGYLTEYNFVDGQALTPTEFGEYDDTTGVWKPKKYTGTYGTNGFYLPMKETQQATGFNTVLWTGNATTTDITGVGFSPDLVWIKGRNTTYSHTLYDSVRGATNYLVSNTTGSEVSASGSLTSFNNDGFSLGVDAYVNGNGANQVAWCWDAGNSGQDYGASLNGSTQFLGFASSSSLAFGTADYTIEGWIKHNSNAKLEGIVGATGTSFQLLIQTNGTLLGSLGGVGNFSTASTTAVPLDKWTHIALVRSSGTFTYYINGVASGTGTDSNNYTATGVTVNIGTTNNSSTFGFNGSLSNFRIVKGSAVYTGNFTPPTSALTAVTNTEILTLQDATLVDNSANGYSITNNGSIKTGIVFPYIQDNNTDGSITSTVRANPDSGFSIVSYTGNGSASQTVGHGLSSAPEMVIVKDRDSSGASDGWYVQSTSLGADEALLLENTTGAFNPATNHFDDTYPTASVFSVNGAYTNGSSKKHIAYCFHSVAGFSKFGSYTGNGSISGPTVTTGFRPAFVMVKRTDTTGSWRMFDATRSIDNPRNDHFKADSSDAESVNDSALAIDFNDTGFQLVGTGLQANASGGSYIYMAFADTRDAQFNFDESGNKNNWTANNINSNASSETTYDIMNDVATLTDEDTANFATLNPVYAGINGLSASNLTFTPSGWMHIPSTIELPTDSTTGIYWEEDLTVAVAANYHASGVTNGKHTASTAFDTNTAVISMSGGAWRLYKSGDANNAVAITGAGGSASNGDVHMFAYKNGYLYWGINGSWYPTGANPATDTSPLNASQITAQQYALCGGYTGITKSINFGQRPFAYTPPTGYKKLNTYNLPDSTIADGSQYMNPVLYTGNGTSQSITGVGFSPDLVWMKERTALNSNQLVDSVRGVQKAVFSDLTLAEIDYGSTHLSSFDSDGFTVENNPNINKSGGSFVAWNWRGSDSSAVSNTDGTITSTVSANTTSGFSVVTYTGNSTAGATVGHGLGVAPKMVIVKQRNSGGTSWTIWHASVVSTWGASYTVFLESTSATLSIPSAFNSTAPSSTVFTLGTGGGSTATNISGNTYVAYCFADVEGFSKFGSYTGNGSADGPFVYTGFRPAFVMAKRTDSTSDWFMLDNERPDFNVIGGGNGGQLAANQSYAESTLSTYAIADLLSNGFKVKHDMTYGYWNASGGTYIYMAFAENPFKQSLAR